MPALLFTSNSYRHYSGTIMTPWTHLGLVKIPNDGGELELTQRDKEFSIHLKGARGELMNSRMHSSEIALSDLGCAHIKNTENAKVLVGGMGIMALKVLLMAIITIFIH